MVRLVLKNAGAKTTTVAALDDALARAIEDATRFGDVGRALTDLYLVHRGHIADLRGMVSADAARALAQEETAGCDPSQAVTIITVSRAA